MLSKKWRRHFWQHLVYTLFAKVQVQSYKDFTKLRIQLHPKMMQNVCNSVYYLIDRIFLLRFYSCTWSNISVFQLVVCPTFGKDRHWEKCRWWYCLLMAAENGKGIRWLWPYLLWNVSVGTNYQFFSFSSRDIPSFSYHLGNHPFIKNLPQI